MNKNYPYPIPALCKAIVIFSLMACTCVVQAQPTIQWEKCIGGSLQDGATGIEQTSDGGYIVVGFSSSGDGNIVGQDWNLNAWVAKLDATGAITWQKAIGGTTLDAALAVKPTSDGGYIVVGETQSNDGDVTNYHGAVDVLAIKLTAAGAISWCKAFGGNLSETALGVCETSDGGYAIVGTARSSSGDVSSSHDVSGDLWVLKITAAGAKVWDRCYGGFNIDMGASISTTTDGGFIVAGSTHSDDGDVTTANNGLRDGWILKITSTGTISWAKTYGGAGIDQINAIAQTTDGGYIACGETLSSDGDITGQHGGSDIWVMKLTSAGNITWSKCFGGTKNDMGYAVFEDGNGSFVIGASTSSNNGDISGLHSNDTLDFWVAKISTGGNIIWSKCMGGTGQDALAQLSKCSSGYIMAGYAGAGNGDVSGFHSGTYKQDAWVAKVNSPAGISDTKPGSEINLYPTTSADGIFFADIPPAIETTFSISDLAGRPIPFNTFKQQDGYVLQLGNVAAGIYIVRAQTGHQAYSFKVLFTP